MGNLFYMPAGYHSGGDFAWHHFNHHTMKQELHFQKGDLTGEISFTLKEDLTLHDLFALYVFDYDPKRFEPCAFRLLMGKENILTLFAVDGKTIAASKEINSDRIPVKKFKITHVPFSEIAEFFGEINFTVTANKFPIEAMDVTDY